MKIFGLSLWVQSFWRGSKVCLLVAMLPLIASCGGGSQACNGSGFAFGSLVGDLCKNSSSPREVQTSTLTQDQTAILSGTAAAGSPIQGKVQVTDAQGFQQSTEIGADGFYSVNVGGMTGPFIVKAQGTSACAPVTYYAGATAADVGGNVNVTPMTDLILSSIAGQGTNAHLSSQAAVQKLAVDLTDIKLRQAQAALVLKLRPVLLALGVSEPVDLIKSVFKTDQSGLDALLDLVKVESDAAGGEVTLRNRITQDEMAVIPLSQPISPTPIASNKTAGISAAAASDVHAIGEVFCQFQTLFESSPPTLQRLANSGLLDTSKNFIAGGETFQQFAAGFNSSEFVGTRFSNWSLVQFVPGVEATVNMSVAIPSRTPYAPSTEVLTLSKVAGRWLITGDQQIASTDFKNEHLLSMQVNHQLTVTGPTPMRNGIRFVVDANARNNNEKGLPRITAAEMTGLGIEGVLQFNANAGNGMSILGPALTDGNSLWDCASASASEIALFCLDVAAVRVTSPYNLLLKDAQGQALNAAGYKVKLDRAPLGFDQLSPNLFVQIASASLNGSPVTAAAFGPNRGMRLVFNLPPKTHIQSVTLRVSGNNVTDFQQRYEIPTGAALGVLGWGNALSTGTVSRVNFRIEAFSEAGLKFLTLVDMSVPAN